MTTHLAIAGPAKPAGLAHWLYPKYQAVAHQRKGAGGGTLVNNIVECILRAGGYVELVTLEADLEHQICLEGPNLRIFVGPYRTRARARAADLFRAERLHVANLLKMTSAPVVSAQWTYEYALGALSDVDRPSVVTAQDAPFTILNHSRDRYRLVRTAIAMWARIHIKHLAANSPYLAGAWRRQMLYRKPIAVIPNVVIPVPINSGTSTDSNRADYPVVLEVSDSSKRKNVAALIRAFRSVRRCCPDAQLRIVGPGLTSDSSFGTLGRALGLGGSLTLLGPLAPEELAAEYSRATVFAHASLEESFGMTVAEAMSQGVPVVAGAKAGALPWLLDGGEAGLLTDVTHPGAFALSICDLLDDDRLRARLGHAGRVRTESEFSPARIAKIWTDVVDQLGCS